MSLSVHTILLCDDIRKEFNGKDILIGVYSDGIIVGAYPQILPMSVWCLLQPKKTGNYECELRVQAPSGNPPLTVNFGLQADNTQLTTLAVQGMPVHLERDGKLTISFRAKGGDWKEVRTYSVNRGIVPQPNQLGLPPSN